MFLRNVKLSLEWAFHFADYDVPRQGFSTEATHNPGDNNQNETKENLMLQHTIINSKLLSCLVDSFREKR